MLMLVGWICPLLAAEPDPVVFVIPRPLKLTVLPGTFVAGPDVVILADAAARTGGERLAEALKPVVGRALAVKALAHDSPREGAIVLQQSPELAGLGEEGYRLDVQPRTVVLQAAKPAGLFYACQTLRQLLLFAPDAAAGRGAVACLQIEDRPRFGWRGLMLDPARYFLSVSFLKRYVDLAAQYKLNRLHLHLTDDLGWTLEIRKYPELTDMARWPMTPANRNRGVYTQAEMRELVAYAAERNVILVPELELPGHNGIPGWTLRDQVLCPNNPCRDRGKVWDENETYKWVEPCVASPASQAVYTNILREVMDVFPGPYIHLGGDEYFGLAWAQCPDCQKLIETANLRRYDNTERKRRFSNCLGNREKYLLYRHLMTRMCDFVTLQGRRPVLWDDLSWQGDFPAGAVIMQWHYEGGGDAWQQIQHTVNPAAEAARAGRDAVIAPYSHLYFDLGSSLEAVYRFEPLPAGLTPQEQERILGPHAPVWNQRESAVDARTFPRLYALAELGWSPAAPRDWNAFRQRVDVHEELRALSPAGAGARGIGRWTREQMAPQEQRVTLTWDASRVVTLPGAYDVVLTYQAGMDGVYIDWVALLEDGRELARDTHKGWSGAAKEQHAYTVKLEKVQPGAAYAVQAQLWIPHGGTDSRGAVTMGRKP